MAGKSFLETAVTVDTRKVAEQTFISTFRSPRISALVEAGQFVMVSFPGTIDPLLPRAFSVCDVEDDTLSLLYVAVGRGTRKISELMPGAELILNGPLGNGFPERESGRKIWVAVGGSGAAILPILSRSAKRVGSEVRFFYGARTMSQLVPFKEATNIAHATDDGSAGFHGNVVGLLKQELRRDTPEMLFGCGPTPMLVSMQKEFGTKIPTYLSVETPMACGMGLCQGCPIKKSDSVDYYLACKDGPVFRSTEIEFEVKP